MRKLMIFCVSISAFAICVAMVLKLTYEQRWSDPLLIENAVALAQDNGEGAMNPDEEGGSGGGSGTCGAKAWTGDSWEIVCKVSYAYAMMVYNWWNTPYKWWCCDSCSSSTYCGN